MASSAEYLAQFAEKRLNPALMVRGADGAIRRHDIVAAPFKVLVVDDDDSNRRLAVECLDGVEFSTVEAASGAAALAAIRNHDFDCVLLDKRLPDMDGEDICPMIRCMPQGRLLPVLMMTGSQHVGDLVRSLGASADDFIRKPYVPVEMRARVHAAAQRKRHTDDLESAEAILLALARVVEARDGTTVDHCTRLLKLGRIFGRHLGLGAEDQQALERGAILHDIGKVAIPDAILLAPRALTVEESLIMQSHAVIGADLCRGLQSLRRVVPLIRHHHERFDGTGYPDRLSGNAIPELAQIFQLTDVFDALSSVRPYKPSWSREQVVQELLKLRDRGQLNPELLGEFLSFLEHEREAVDALQAAQCGMAGIHQGLALA